MDGRFESAETFQEYIKGFGLFAPIVLIVLQALQVIFPILPGFLGCAVGAVLFGSLGGFWCNYIGISVGSILAFLLFPDDFFCYFSGLTKMKVKKFAAIIIVGKPWCILAYSLAFAAI